MDFRELFGFRQIAALVDGCNAGPETGCGQRGGNRDWENYRAASAAEHAVGLPWLMLK